jgi:hypothetical protein
MILFFFMINMPLFIYATFFLSIHLLVGISNRWFHNLAVVNSSTYMCFLLPCDKLVVLLLGCVHELFKIRIWTLYLHFLEPRITLSTLCMPNKGFHWPAGFMYLVPISM